MNHRNIVSALYSFYNFSEQHLFFENLLYMLHLKYMYRKVKLSFKAGITKWQAVVRMQIEPLSHLDPQSRYLGATNLDRAQSRRQDSNVWRKGGTATLDGGWE